MISTDGILGITLLFQIGLGVIGNVILFAAYAHIFIVSIKQRPLCLIIIHLSLIHVLLVCSSGIPEAIAPLGFRTFMNDITCKTNIYLQRLFRGLSICLTSFLSILQTITISPSGSYWASFKNINLLYIFYSFFFVWILNLLLSSNLIISVAALKNGNLSKNLVKFCFIFPIDDLRRWFFLILMILRDVSFLGSMCWTSGYMMLLLHRHRKQVQHLRRSGISFKMSPEMKAARKIIVFTLCFISSYGLDMIISFSLAYFPKQNLVFLNVKKFTGMSFAFLSPVILLSNNNQLHRFGTSLRKLLTGKKEEIQY